MRGNIAHEKHEKHKILYLIRNVGINFTRFIASYTGNSFRGIKMHKLSK